MQLAQLERICSSQVQLAEFFVDERPAGVCHREIGLQPDSLSEIGKRTIVLLKAPVHLPAKAIEAPVRRPQLQKPVVVFNGIRVSFLIEIGITSRGISIRELRFQADGRVEIRQRRVVLPETCVRLAAIKTRRGKFFAALRT